MSTRTTLRPHAVIVNGDMSADITSQVTILQSLTICSYAFSWAGTSPVGTISIEASNDYSVDAQGNVLNAGTWNILPLSVSGSTVTSAPITGNTGNGAIDIDTNGLYAIRSKYTFTSGIGVLQGTIVGKVG